MRILSRAIFREITSSAILGTLLFTFVLFMQKLGSGKLFEVLLRGSASPKTVGYLLMLLLPAALVFALPLGTLVGVLIGLGRMSADGEIVAMRAAGVPSRRVVAPVLFYGLLAALAAFACSLYFTPLAIRETYRLRNEALAQQLTAEIQPRVFEEQFTNNNTILYVGDVIPSATTTARWKNVFIADLSPPEQRNKPGREFGDAPRITVAAEAIAVPDAVANTIQLSMTGVSTHEVDKDPTIYYNTSAPAGEQLLQARTRSEEGADPIKSLDTLPLIKQARGSRDAQIELHQRFALPLGCLLLSIVGIPLGVSSQRSGKSGAFVMTVFLAFLYWVSMISLIGLAKQSRLPVVLAVWAPNAVFAAFGLLLLINLESPGDTDVLSRLRAFWANTMASVRTFITSRKAASSRLASLPRIPLLPGVVDTYVLSSFLFYFAMLLGSFVLLAHIFIFFELLSEVFAHRIPMARVFTYHFFLTPKLIYDSTPMSVLVAVLVTFGIMAKNNEVTAMKACGVSLYRLSVPIILASAAISGSLFAFDHYYIPEANRIQDSILNEIKGRPIQTYLRPDRKWIFGAPSPTTATLYYYKYFDPAQNLMVNVNVYELDPATFALKRHINAESARWEPSIESWVFQNGWARDLKGVRITNFQQYQATTFAELKEPPNYFLKEVKQEKQLNFVELERYIRELQQSGFDTIRLQVQFHKKFSVPLFAVIMALLSVPFAFLTGNRGAMAGVGVSFGIAIAYWALGRMFEEIGNINQLPAPLAAWSPDVVFALAGMYLFTRMRS
ncbi:MAG: LptF/LptG family permease [Bryobacterales bacterium]|nr:LptF/LptG family permease [Bryobacterales bacterium]